MPETHSGPSPEELYKSHKSAADELKDATVNKIIQQEEFNASSRERRDAFLNQVQGDKTGDSVAIPRGSDDEMLREHLSDLNDQADERLQDAKQAYDNNLNEARQDVVVHPDRYPDKAA